MACHERVRPFRESSLSKGYSYFLKWFERLFLCRPPLVIPILQSDRAGETPYNLPQSSMSPEAVSSPPRPDQVFMKS